MVIELPKDVPLPATGTINYKSILVKVNFPEDLWVAAADLRPGNREAVHHMRAIVRPPGSQWMKDAVAGGAYEKRDPVVGGGGGGAGLFWEVNLGLAGPGFTLFSA